MNKNPISRLQEICQQWKFPVPVYSEGEGDFGTFGTELTIHIEDDVVGLQGRGRTKKESKANVALKALEYIENNCPKFLEPPPPPVSKNAL